MAESGRVGDGAGEELDGESAAGGTLQRARNDRGVTGAEGRCKVGEVLEIVWPGGGTDRMVRCHAIAAEIDPQSRIREDRIVPDGIAAAEDRHAGGAVKSDGIARATGRSADEIAVSLDPHAHGPIAQGGGAVFSGADEVALHPVARRPGADLKADAIAGLTAAVAGAEVSRPGHRPA